MAPKYQLFYFDFRGLAEPIRMMFNLRGIEFTDNRLTHEEWNIRKADRKVFPTGQAPVLIVDDKVIPQSNAICRYLAREYGFFGANSLEGAEIDVVIETLGDIKQRWLSIYYEHDELKRAEMVQAFIETTAKPYFTFLEDLIKKTDGKNFVGHKITLADIYIFHNLDMLTNSKNMIEGVLDPYPALTAFSTLSRRKNPSTPTWPLGPS